MSISIGTLDALGYNMYYYALISIFLKATRPYNFCDHKISDE